MKADALVIANQEIIADAMVTARDPRLIAQTPAARPDTMDPNIKAVKVFRGGKEMVEFYGEHFVRGMSQKGRRVVGWNTSTGRFMPAEIHGGDKDTGAIIALDGRLSSPPPEQKRLPPLVEGTLTPGAAKFGKLIDMINLQLVWSGDKRIRDVCLATALGFEHPKRIR
jgi:hypothetical protein